MVKLEKSIRYGIYLTALMPLIIFSEFLSPFHFGKVVIFRSLIELLGILYVALIFDNKNFLPKTDKIFWAITAFVAVFGLTSLTSINIYQSIFGTLERMGGWLTLFHFWIFFVILISVIRTKEEWFKLIKISVVVSLLSTLYGFLQKTDASFIVGSGNRARIFGTIGNTALFAGYLIVNIFFSLLLVFKKDLSRNSKLFYGIVLFLNLVALMMTAVRGSILGMVVAVVLLVFTYPKTQKSKKLRCFLIAVLVLGFIIELVLILNRTSDFVKNSRYLSRMADISLQSPTAATRFWAWRAGMDGWNDSLGRIIFGWGPENFNIPFSKHFNPKFYVGPGSETMFDRAHNMFVEVLVTMGILGFLAYLGVFVFLYRIICSRLKGNSSEEDRNFASILFSGLTAYVIHNFFIFDTSANFLVFFTMSGLIYRLNLGWGEIVSLNSKKVRKNDPIKYSVIILLIIIIFTSIYLTNVKPSLANYATTRGIIASWAGNHDQAIEKFKQAMDYDTWGSYEIRNRYGQYLLENYTRIRPVEKISPTILDAIDQIKKNLSYREDYLAYLYISRAYITLGKDNPKSVYNDLALENALNALKISPTFVRTYYEIAQAYLNKKDKDKAVEYFKKAAELNPDVGQSFWYWGIVEIDRGNEARGLELVWYSIEKGYAANKNDYSRILKIYIAKNDRENIIRVYKKLIDLNPKDPQHYASLAVAYAKNGDLDNAMQSARAAVRLDPSFEQEARAFARSFGREL